MKDENNKAIALADVLDLLNNGQMEVKGLLPGSSNYTFLAEVSNDQHDGLVVYKPKQGEAPLWDFPHGSLCNRELAAFLVSQALGWNLVPPTVMRVGPYGKGAVQYFVDADFSQHYFTFRDEPELRPVLERIAAFDVVINNADRKGGHTLRDHDGRIWAIDHGVCFHTQSKLRTVIWEFAEEPVPADVLQDLAALRGRMVPDCDLYRSLNKLLSDAELRAVAKRTERLLESCIFPAPDPYRRSYPWPLV